MKKHFSVLDQYEIDAALTSVWQELDELQAELEELDRQSNRIPQLRRAMDDVSSAKLHYREYLKEKPKWFFERRDVETDDNVRFIAGAAYDLADLLAQEARKEIDALRPRHA